MRFINLSNRAGTRSGHILCKKAEKINDVQEETGIGKSLKDCRINCAVIIPSLNPIPELPDFVQELLSMGVSEVIVVNDGSDYKYEYIFEALKQISHCTVLTHEVNRGKGRALKTAFSFFLEHFSYMNGVVTADADGQHSVEDICNLCNILSVKKEVLILGVRDFHENNVPKRSYIGNMLTSTIFHLLYGCKLNDTQTGLRGISTKELPEMIGLKGERYDYEINMLIKARTINLKLYTVPIKTLYFDNNSGSHYSTVKDSIFIFFRLILGLIERFISSITGLFVVEKSEKVQKKERV